MQVHYILLYFGDLLLKIVVNLAVRSISMESSCQSLALGCEDVKHYVLFVELSGSQARVGSPDELKVSDRFKSTFYSSLRAGEKSSDNA